MSGLVEADWVEPEDFFVAHAARQPRAFWLDGSGARPWTCRTSYVGWLDPEQLSLKYDAGKREVTAHDHETPRVIGDDIFAALARDSEPEDALHGGWIGYFGYAAREDLPARTGAEPTLDACWMRATKYVAFDHERRSVRAVSSVRDRGRWSNAVAAMVSSTQPAAAPAGPPPATIISTVDRAHFGEAFVRVQSELRRGNSYETNLTFRTVVASLADPVSTYRRLRRLSPAPYAAFIAHQGTSLLSSSPERFARLSVDGWLETRPIKGTTPRYDDPVLDAEAARRLVSEPKFRGENLMIVDLLRNDLSQVCRVGTVEVTDLMHVESYPSVHQLVSTIRGRLRDDVTMVQALHALFPGGSMTGAPKQRTMQIIADVETTARGVYSGALGWIRDDGSVDLGIIIRSLVHEGEHYTLGTGGGITVRSDWDEEYAETQWKAQALLLSLGVELNRDIASKGR
ncbi:MAG: aminodeoxychorismate synthase component I [Nocardioidaceae bacterium]